MGWGGVGGRGGVRWGSSRHGGCGFAGERGPEVGVGADPGEQIVVGVNAFREGNEDDEPELLRITVEQERHQVKRLGATKADRDSDAVARSLDAVRTVAADPEADLMPALVDAVAVMATEGERVDALAEVFGRYRQPL